MLFRGFVSGFCNFGRWIRRHPGVMQLEISSGVVQQRQGTSRAFAAIVGDRSVVTWDHVVSYASSCFVNLSMYRCPPGCCLVPRVYVYTLVHLGSIQGP